MSRSLAFLWLAYACFYLSRLALATAKPELASEGVSLELLGLFDALFLGAYALGQYINGRLVDRHSARGLFLLGLVPVLVAAACVLLGRSRRG